MSAASEARVSAAAGGAIGAVVSGSEAIGTVIASDLGRSAAECVIDGDLGTAWRRA